MNQNRRDFFKKSLVVMGAGLVLPSLLASVVQAEEPRRRTRGGEAGGKPGEVPLVKPGVGMAVSLNYVEDHKDIKDAKLKTERSGVPFEKQLCSGCMLYTKEKGSGGEEVGKCQLFAGQHVKGKGWCTSWAKKA